MVSSDKKKGPTALSVTRFKNVHADSISFAINTSINTINSINARINASINARINASDSIATPTPVKTVHTKKDTDLGRYTPEKGPIHICGS